MKYNLTSKKVIVAAVCLSVIGGFISSALNSQPTGATEEPPIVTEVQRQGEVLDNHEARISNTENDVKDLQTNTGTAPSTTKVYVPTNSTSAASTSTPPTSSTPAPPSPVTTTAFREIIIDGDTSDCEYTYSDGTTYIWHWKTSNLQGAWVTDSQGLNGHWVKTVNTSSNCDNSVIGQQKQS